MYNSRFLLLILVSFFLTTQLVFSQQIRGGKSSKTQLTFVTWDVIDLGDLYYYTGSKYEQIKLYRGQRSNKYSASGVSNLTLHTRDYDQDGQEIFPVVGKTTLLLGSREQLVFVFRKNSSELPLRLSTIDDGFDSFPQGSFRFVNLYGEALKIAFNKKIVDLPDKGIEALKSNVPQEGAMMPCVIADLKGNVVFDTRLLAQQNGRDMVFLFPPREGSNRALAKFLSQRLPIE